MGNIGSEVGRAFIARRNGDQDRCQSAVHRALDLFAATLEVLDDSARRSEIKQCQEQFLAILADDRFDETRAQELDTYFYHFALAARRGR